MKQLFTIGIFTFLITLPAQAYKGLGVGSVSPKLLQKYAPKAIDFETSNQVRHYLDLIGPGIGQVSPDGKSLYFTWAISGSRQLWKLDGPNQFPIMLTSGEERTAMLDFAPDGSYAVISRDANGQENPGIYMLSTKDYSMKEIYRKKGVQAHYSFITQDSKKIYFSTNEKSTSSYATYSYDLPTGKIEEVFSEPGLWFISDVRQDEKEWIMGKQVSSIHNEYYLFDPQAKTLHPLLGQNDNDEYNVQYAARAANTYIVRTDKFEDFFRLYEWQENGKFTPITPEMKADVTGASASHTNKLLFYTVNDGGYQRLIRIDPKTYQEIKMPIFKDSSSIGLANISQNERYVTLAVGSSLHPLVPYVYDAQKNTVTEWIFPSAPEIDLSKSVAEKLEYYPARDGTQIPMFVYRPKECEATLCPVIVNFHGGPELQSSPDFNVYTQMLNKNGFVVVYPNVRGSDGYGRKWRDSDNGAKRFSVITDIEDISIFIRKNWAKNGVAPKIGADGGSYGGYATLMAMSYFAGAFDAGVSNVGISNLLTFLVNTAPYRRVMRVSEYGDPVKDKDILKKLSPITYAKKVKAPLLLIQGSEDPRVPVGEALQFYNILQKKKIPSELIIFPDEGHGAAKSSNIILQIGHTIRFFKTYLSAKK